MSMTSAPVVACSCAEGWKPEGWAYCAECYEGQIERLRLNHKDVVQSKRRTNERLRIAIETLNSIANNSCCDGCQEAAKVARAGMAQVTGHVGGSPAPETRER